jgi:hypothetical protein
MKTAIARWWAVAGLLVSLAGLALNFSVIAPSMMVVSETNPVARSLPGMLVHFWSFFTHLSNLGLVMVYAAVLSGWRSIGWFKTPVGMASMAGNIALVMLYFHFMLSPLYVFTGALAVANVLLHYVSPLIYLSFWALFAPHGSLRIGQVPMMLVPGLVYLVLVLVRGAIIAEYPYDLLDPRIGGYGQVAIGAGVIVLAVAVFCAILVLADRLLGGDNRRA